MSDDLWTRDEVQSPCIKICIVHPAERICTGCFRSLDEIAQWSKMEDGARLDLIAKLPDRAARLKVRRGGHKARVG